MRLRDSAGENVEAPGTVMKWDLLARGRVSLLR
jgi:hypothetical protein